MGYIPLFLSLAGFTFLFVMLVSQSMKSKRAAYLKLAEDFLVTANEYWKEEASLARLFNQGETGLKEILDRVRPYADESKLRPMVKQVIRAGSKAHQFNQLLLKQPYRTVGQIMGYSPINLKELKHP